MTKKLHWKDTVFYSDYPLTQDANGEWIQGVWRRFKVLSYTGNKYGQFECLDEPRGECSFKIGYLLRDKDDDGSYIQRLELLQIIAGTKRNVRLRQDQKTTYDVYEPWQSHRQLRTITVNTLKAALRIARKYRYGATITRYQRRPNGWGMSGGFMEFGPHRVTYVYSKNNGKPGPRVREYERT